MPIFKSPIRLPQEPALNACMGLARLCICITDDVRPQGTADKYEHSSLLLTLRANLQLSHWEGDHLLEPSPTRIEYRDFQAWPRLAKAMSGG